MTTNLLDLIQHESGVTLKRQTAKEYSGACPFCHAGNDRFRVWPLENRYWCRVCDRKGDSIQFLREHKHLTFAQAKEATAGMVAAEPAHVDRPAHSAVKTCELSAPAAAWLEPARQFVRDCYFKLYGFDGARALTWLHGRGLQTDILTGNGIGLNPVDQYLDRQSWGLAPETRDDGAPKRLWLPKGIVIPWFYEGELWGIRIRRPAGDPKYFWIPGGTMGMYGATTIKAGYPAIITEGELDALSIRQALTRPAAVVATGSTNGGRHLRWLARLAAASIVLVAYDADEAGETAAQFWLDALSNARRWRPYWHDANDMARDGADVGAWMAAGLQWAS